MNQQHKPAIDWTKPLRTVETHKPARLLGVLRRCGQHDDYNYIVAITQYHSENKIHESELHFQEDGSSCTSIRLENIPQKITREYWVNEYESSNMACLYDTKEDADNSASSNRIACHKIIYTFEEGEGL